MEKIYKTRAFLFAIVILLLTSFNLSNLKAQHQPFGEAGAEWYMMQQQWPLTVPHIYTLNPFKISNVGEAVIQDKLCQMLTFENLGYAFYSFGLHLYALNDTMYIHNDSGRIYYFDYIADHFKLMFDFNAEIGENWVGEFPCEDSTLIWYEPMFFQDTFNYIVNNISYLETEGPSLKRLHVNRIGHIIERIGWPGFILPPYEDLCQHLDHNDPVFLCSYYDPEVGLIKFQDYDCKTQILVTSTSEVDETEFAISPNPTFDEIFIQLPENVFGFQSLQVEIYNQLGQRVLHQTLSSPTVEVGHLPAGIYFVHLKGEEVHFKVQKLFVLK